MYEFDTDSCQTKTLLTDGVKHVEI